MYTTDAINFEWQTAKPPITAADYVVLLKTNRLLVDEKLIWDFSIKSYDN